MRKIVKRENALDKLAQKIAKKGSGSSYKEGSPDEKVWINFQSSKRQKRDFAQACNDNSINASAFLRDCVRLLISLKGDVSKTLKEVKSRLNPSLESKEE